MEWNFDDPADVLESYYKGYDDYNKRKSELDEKKKNLKGEQNKLSEFRSKLDEARKKLRSFGEFQGIDVDSQTRDIVRDADDKIDAARKAFDENYANLTNNKAVSINDNNMWLKKMLDKVKGNGIDKDAPLDDIRQKVLEFETERRNYMFAADERINQHQDDASREQLDCENAVGGLQEKINTIFEKYAPDVDKYSKIVDKIDKKHQPNINKCRAELDEEKSLAENEKMQLYNELTAARRLCDTEVNNLNREYKAIEKDYNKQIRAASKNGSPTAALTNSKMSKLSEISSRITNAQNKLAREESKINQQIKSSENKYKPIIEKVIAKMEKAIADYDNERREPYLKYTELVNSRDTEIEPIKARIAARKAQCEKIVAEHSNSIYFEESGKVAKNESVDKEIVDFVMNGDNCLGDVLNEAYKPFAALSGKMGDWMGMLDVMAKDKMSVRYQKEHEKQKSLLSGMNYGQLCKEAGEAEKFTNKLRPVERYNKVFATIGTAVLALGVLLAIVLFVILRTLSSFAFLFLAILGLWMLVYTVLQTQKQFSNICKYVSLAYDYKEFDGIAAYSNNVTRQRELEKWKTLGSDLYDALHAGDKFVEMHAAKEADINSDYEREVQILNAGLNNTVQEIEREKNKALANIKTTAAGERQDYDTNKKNLKDEIDSLASKTGSVERGIHSLESRINKDKEFINDYEKNYAILASKLNDVEWRPKLSDTKGVLADMLYVIPEESKDGGHKPVFLITHNKKPLVITFDKADMSGEGSNAEQLGVIVQRLITDLMYSVYRMNSKENYLQIVVNELGGTDKLKQTQIKNTFNIVDVFQSMDDIGRYLEEFNRQRNSLAEKGMTIDELNRERFKTGDSPESYCIIYFVLGGAKSRLPDEIGRLSIECDKYGFLPIFICEKEAWRAGNAANNSIYKDINDLLKNPVVTYKECRFEQK